MSAIAKTTIYLMVLHEADLDLSCRSLRNLAHEIHEGGMLGSRAIVAVEAVPPGALAAECEELGGTAGFFDGADEGASPWRGKENRTRKGEGGWGLGERCPAPRRRGGPLGVAA